MLSEVTKAWPFKYEHLLYRLKPTRLMLIKMHQRLYRRLCKEEREKCIRYPSHLNNFERRVYSQNGEDGILSEIFRRIGTTDKFFVEFGIEDGVETRCRYLLEREGWNGLWIEGGTEDAAKAFTRFAGFPVQIRQVFLTLDNVHGTFSAPNVPKHFDLLVVDIDGNDYWMWERILQKYSPRVAVIEVNAGFPPGVSFLTPYSANRRWDGRKRTLGASIDPLVSLGKKNGYRLVACDSNGVNAFFVREDVAATHFLNPENPADFFYSAPKYLPDWFGHPPLDKTRDDFPMRRLPPRVAERIRLSLLEAAPTHLKSDQPFRFCIQVENKSDHYLRSETPYYLKKRPEYPVNLSYQWTRMDLKSARTEGLRTYLIPSSMPGSTEIYSVSGVTPGEPGEYELLITLVQENNSWFHDLDPACSIRTSIVIEDKRKIESPV